MSSSLLLFSTTTVAERLGAELVVPAVTKLGRSDGEGGGVVDSGSGGGTEAARSSTAPFIQLSAYPAIEIDRERKNIIAADRSLPWDEILMLYYLSCEDYWAKHAGTTSAQILLGAGTALNFGLDGFNNFVM